MTPRICHDLAIAPAMRILPADMDSPAARGLLIAIALQESRLVYRRQIHGPARGFWMFEVAGVRGVLTHPRSKPLIMQALRTLQYDHTMEAAALQPLLEHNDVLAACFARCLLWTSPLALPELGAPAAAWFVYFSLWRPGRPRRDTWDAYYRQAWDRTPRDEDLMATIFSQQQLARIVEETIPAAASGFTHVVVGTVDQNGAQVVVGFKKKETSAGIKWELQAAARHDWTGENTIGGRVLLKW